MVESQFRIVNLPELTEFSFIKNTEFSFEGDLEMDISANVDTFIKGDPNCNDGRVDLKIKVFDSLPFDKAPFVIKATITGYFSWDDEISSDRKNLEALLNINGASLLYSYLRPIISNITMNASLPPLILPLMNFVKQE